MFNHKWHLVTLLGILMLAALLRFWQLGFLPHGFTWDEAAIGYNGHAVITTRRDEWLKRIPISFRSFGDYKAPLAIYLNGFFTVVLGNHPWVVRLPFAIGGVLAVWGMYCTMYELLAIRTMVPEKSKQLISLASAAALAISTWHIHFSRVGFEAGLALTLCLLMIASLLKGLRQQNIFWISIGLTWAVASLYAYHSTKIATPLLLLVVSWYAGWWRSLQPKYVWAIGWAALLSAPLVYDIIFGAGLTRASTLLLSKGYGLGEFVSIFGSHWAKQLSIDFLFFGWSDTLRHGTQKYGVLYLLDAVPLLWLIVRAITTQLKSQKSELTITRQIGFFALVVVAGLLPAALGDLVPHPNRALLALPGFIGLIVLGWYDLLRFFNVRKTAFLVGLVYLIQLAVFSSYYQTTYAQASAPAFTDGYIEAAQIADQIEQEGWQGVIPEKIMFTSDYGQPYIFVLFVKNTNPIWYQGGSLIKYEFTENITVGDLSRPKTLIVASAHDDIPMDWANKLIYGSDGEVVFKIYFPKEKP